jgi:serine/threonine protein kinase
MVPCQRCAVPCDEGHRFCFACGAELTPPTVLEDPLVGRTLPGGYRVTHLVGVGGMGRVYCAEQVALGRTVAVKVVHPSLADEELTSARFLNEARAASRLSHPNSVAIFDFGRTDDGRPYIVMEYLRGRDLGRVASDEGPLSLPRMVDVLRQSLGALEEAHALGIVHRDLKPDNIVLEPLRSGLDFVKVVDFGLAKILQEDAQAKGAGALTRPGLVCGTPEYMSPEQSRGDALDGRSDLYSVGVVLFELLTGRVPFVADTATKTLLLHLTEPAPDPRDVTPERSIPAPFAEVAARALAKSCEDRFQSAREFADALDSALLESEGRLTFDPPPSTTVRCKTCGAPCPTGQKFCGECGASIASKPPPGSSRRPGSSPPIPRDDGAAALVAAEAISIAPALPLLARDDAMEWLDSRYHEASAVLAVARVVGDAGMGKTRLVRELLGRCAQRGDFVVSVSPEPAWARVGDAAIKTAIRALAGLPDGSVDGSAWDGAYPDARMGLDLLFGVGDGSPPSGPGRRHSLAEALRWALEAAAERARAGPVVLAIDDLDFIDGTSKSAIEDVLAEPPLVSALLVITHSPGSGPNAETLPAETWVLEPLPFDAFADRVPPRLATRGVALAPLHVEQLIAWSRESPDPAPELLVDVIARRVERLPPDGRHVLQALAVWGDDATPDCLWRMLPPASDVAAALDALDRARIVAIDERGIRIAHPLLRRVVFSSIPAGRKQELFARASGLRLDAPLEVRAKQAMHGGSALEALSLLDALSARRAAHGDLAGSVSTLRHALDVARRELHRGEIDDPVGAVLIFSRKLAEALADAEAWPDAEGVLREALGTAPPASPHRAHLLGVLARVADARRHPDEARRYLDEAMRVARQSDARSLFPILERLDKTIAVA